MSSVPTLPPNRFLREDEEEEDFMDSPRLLLTSFFGTYPEEILEKLQLLKQKSFEMVNIEGQVNDSEFVGKVWVQVDEAEVHEYDSVNDFFEKNPDFGTGNIARKIFVKVNLNGGDPTSLFHVSFIAFKRAEE